MRNGQDSGSTSEQQNDPSSRVDEATNNARSALRSWRETSVAERCLVLRRAADVLVQEYGEEGEWTPLKRLISGDVGKRLAEADIEIIESSDMVRYFAEHSPELLQPQKLLIESEVWASKQSSLVFEPYGVVAVIKPWNYPLELPLWSIAPALAAGNAVVFKPSELSPQVGRKIARIFEQAGLPPGVLNVVTGGPEIGRSLVESQLIDMISFTGSRKNGVAVARAAAERLIPVSLELGGNDAAVVLEDADLELAANGVLWGAVCNSGQVCVGTKRIFVHEKVAGAFQEKLVEKARGLRPGVDYGPLVSRKQFDVVEHQVEHAVEEGATVLLGAERPADVGSLYYAPTILADIKPTMSIVRDECFGPIMPLIPYRGDDAAAADLVNDSDYGLGASIWTSDLSRGERLAARCNVGMVWVNDVNVALAEAPWGGRKGSGLGVELSPWGLYKYARIKHINTETSLANRRDWWFPYQES